MRMEMMVSWYSVHDLEKAKKFYGEVLGLKKTFEMPRWAEFSHSERGVSIGLAHDGEGRGEKGATVVLRVDDLANTQRELARLGAQFEGEVEEIPGVVRIATFRDPSGNRLQLAQSLLKQ